MARVILLTDFSEEYAKRLLKGIAQYSKENSPWVLCKMPLSYRDLYGVEGVLDWAQKWDADAIIAQFYPDDDVEIFRRHGIVAVAQDFKLPFDNIPNITGDHHRAGCMGARYFISKGFKNFAFYGFEGIVWSEQRCEGFKSELVQHNLLDNYYEYNNVEFKELWYYESDPLIAWLKALPKPVGIMACDDNQGHHIAELCRSYGLNIPQDIALLGVDNDETICNLSDPPLSSIDQAVEIGGYEAAKLIDKLVKEPDSAYKDIYVKPTHIVTRQSTDIYATNDKYISEVLQYIHQNIDKKLDVGTISRLVPMSRRLLENKFREVTGSPIYSYISNLRMQKFAEKLIESDAPIIEIAFELGFSDHKNISRQFRQFKGCTPSEYRASHSLRK